MKFDARSGELHAAPSKAIRLMRAGQASRMTCLASRRCRKGNFQQGRGLAALSGGASKNRARRDPYHPAHPWSNARQRLSMSSASPAGSGRVRASVRIGGSGLLPGAARTADPIGPLAYPCTCPSAGRGRGASSSPWPAALHPPPDLTDLACSQPEVAPAARLGWSGACPDTARTATATPTRTACALTALSDPFHSSFPASTGASLPLTISSSVESG